MTCQPPPVCQQPPVCTPQPVCEPRRTTTTCNRGPFSTTCTTYTEPCAPRMTNCYTSYRSPYSYTPSYYYDSYRYDPYPSYYRPRVYTTCYESTPAEAAAVVAGISFLALLGIFSRY